MGSGLAGRRRIIKAIRARNLPAVITFIDFKKAFDSVKRREMLHILKDFRIPTRLVDAIGKSKGKYWLLFFPLTVKPNSSKSPQVVLQGDIVAPHLFIIVLDYVLLEAIEGHEESLGMTIKPRQRR